MWRIVLQKLVAETAKDFTIMMNFNISKANIKKLILMNKVSKFKREDIKEIK